MKDITFLIKPISQSGYILLLKKKEKNEKYFNLRLKLFIKRFVCSLFEIKEKTQCKKEPVSLGSFGYNLEKSENNTYKITSLKAPVHPLEWMVKDMPYFIPTNSCCDFIVGLSNSEILIRYGFWYGSLPPDYSHFVHSKLYNCTRYIRQRYSKKPFKSTLDEDLIKFIDTEFTYHENKRIKNV